ncbi:Kinesin-like protein [Dirofilaria immitis]
MCFHLFLFPFRRKVDCLVSYRGRLHGARWAKAEWIGSWRWWKREEKGRQGYNSILHTRVLLNRTLIRASGWQQEEDDEKGGWEHPDQSSIKLLLECASRRLSIVDMSSSFVLPHAILLSCAHPPTTHLSETVSTIFQSWVRAYYIEMFIQVISNLLIVWLVVVYNDQLPFFRKKFTTSIHSEIIHPTF